MIKWEKAFYLKKKMTKQNRPPSSTVFLSSLCFTQFVSLCFYLLTFCFMFHTFFFPPFSSPSAPPTPLWLSTPTSSNTDGYIWTITSLQPRPVNPGSRGRWGISESGAAPRILLAPFSGRRARATVWFLCSNFFERRLFTRQISTNTTTIRYTELFKNFYRLMKCWVKLYRAERKPSRNDAVSSGPELIGKEKNVKYFL